MGGAQALRELQAAAREAAAKHLEDTEVLIETQAKENRDTKMMLRDQVSGRIFKDPNDLI